MLYYEKFAPEHDDDIEIRYTNVELRSHGSSAAGVVGRATSESVSLWARMRVPTGWGVVWDRPVRYVYEVATTRYLGSETELGLKQMSSVGFGLELDSSAYDVWATRWRLIGRYKFGPGMRGQAGGSASESPPCGSIHQGDLVLRCREVEAYSRLTRKRQVVLRPSP